MILAKRYFAVSVEGAVNLYIDIMEDKVEVVEVDWHQKNEELYGVIHLSKKSKRKEIK